MLTFNKTGSEDLLTSKEAAALSGYKLDYVDQLCHEKKIDCQMIGGQWHISKQSLLNHRLNSEMRSAPEAPADAGGRTKIVAKHRPTVELKSGPRGGRKTIHMIKVPLVREHFSGKKLARLHQAISEGSLQASKVLQGSVSHMPARDFWHKALSMMTAIALVFGSYYVFQSGFLAGQVKEMAQMSRETTSAAAGLTAEDLWTGANAVSDRAFDNILGGSNKISYIAHEAKQKIILGALTVKFAKDEISTDPFGFMLRAGYELVYDLERFGNRVKFIAYFSAGIMTMAAVGLWR
ncbi:MAG: helix-turn-helix domain-containing protein [Candidatus Taylorbacteria bacterium]|nr:helix-turn-helix domain-containing protein [Candidatus Taylorbacteria bacterium]